MSSPVLLADTRRRGAIKPVRPRKPKRAETGADLLARHLLGYALVPVYSDEVDGQPALVLGPLQRPLDGARVDRLVELGLGGLHRESTEHALAFSIDPGLVDAGSLTKEPAGPFHLARFTASAKGATMLLHAGQHRRTALTVLFQSEIALFDTLTEIAHHSEGDRRRLEQVAALLRQDATWLVAMYDRTLERNAEEYFPFLLQVGSASGLGDTEEDRYMRIVRAVGSVGTEAGRQKVREWAAAQKDTAVRRLVTGCPDVIDLFAELHEIQAFREECVAPADLLESKRVTWGLLEPCIRGMLVVVRWLASPQKIPVTDAETVGPSTALAIHARLVRKLAAKPDFPFSQRVVDALVSGAGAVFRKWLEPHMALFAAGSVRGRHSLWRSVFAHYRDDVVCGAEGWVADHEIAARASGRPQPPLTKDERKTISRLAAKLAMILDYRDVAAGYPMLPHVSSTTFPLLCPAVVTALHREFEAIAPLCRLVASWFVPGVTDTARPRVAPRSVHADPILSETEQVLHLLRYFQHRGTGGLAWEQLTPAQIGAAVPNGERYSNEHLLTESFYEMIGVLLRVRGSSLTELLPTLAAEVWAKLEDDDGYTDEQEIDYLHAMGLWAKKSIALGGPTRGQLRLVQTCPTELAEQLPDDLRAFCERTCVNWTAAASASGVRNNESGRKRFLATASFELRTTAAVHLPLLEREPGLCQLRTRLLVAVHAAPGLSDFDYWYSPKNLHRDSAHQLSCGGDEFMTLSGKRMEVARREVGVAGVLNRLIGQLARSDVIGVPLEQAPKEKQRYGLDPAVRTALWELSRVVMEVARDVQSAHVGMPAPRNDLSRVDDRGEWHRYRGLRAPVFASVSETSAFFARRPETPDASGRKRKGAEEDGPSGDGRSEAKRRRLEEGAVETTKITSQ